MIYRVEFTRRAAEDLYTIAEWATSEAPLQGRLWVQRFLDVIQSLETFPSRHPIQPEVSERGRSVRQSVFGRNRNLYRIYYEIVGDAVRILHIRHGAKPPVTEL